jgi:crotonyl-CoA carboxylase/reductase
VVIREEPFGGPIEAFQLEEIEVPEPRPQVTVRMMTAGVNYNNVWAALRKPASATKYGDHPDEYGHHIGGSAASGVVWKADNA